MRPAPVSLALAAALALSACKKPEEGPLPICRAEVAQSEAQEVASGDVPADIWFLIMLRNFNRDTMQVERPVHDCSGREVDATPPPEVATCLAGTEQPGATAPGPLTEDDLLITPLPDGRMLVWVTSTHFENGEATGPIAIAQWSKRGILIRAIGTLRAHTDRAAMRLEPMGNGQVLVVESRVCDPDNPKKCSRVIRLQPLERDRFIQTALVNDEGACIGPPKLDMFREQVVELGPTLHRKFEMARSIDFDEGAVVVNEQVTVKDNDPTQPDLPPKLFRKANVTRPLTLDGRMLKTKEGLWDKMLAEHGSVRVQAPPESADQDPAGAQPE